MNGKKLCDKHFGMTEYRLKLEQIIMQIFSEIDWLHPDYFGLNVETCDSDFKLFEFTISNYIFHNISEYNYKIQKILFDNGYVKSNEIKNKMMKINNVNTIVHENPLFIAMSLLDNVIIYELCKNGITIANFKGNNSAYPYCKVIISKDAMEKL